MKSHKKNLFDKSPCNPLEHKQWSRRSFLQAMGLTGGAALTLSNTKITASQTTALSAALNEAETDRIFVVLKLNGGNDSLGTFVPMYDFGTYVEKRPKIAYTENSLVKLNDSFSVPSSASSLETLWNDGQMKLVQGVGFKNSALSHFRIGDSWHTAHTNRNYKVGWFGRWFEEKFPDYLASPPVNPAAIRIGGSNIPFTDGDIGYEFTVGSAEKLEEIAKSSALYDLSKINTDCLVGEQVSFLRGTANSLNTYSNRISEAYFKSSNYDGYPNSSLGKQFNLASRMIKGNLGTKVYHLSIGGFDTHKNQNSRFPRLMSHFTNAIKAFYADLKDAGLADKVLTMAYSEFGRRTAENGSRGTDHGRGQTVMLFTGDLEDGSSFMGENYDLQNNIHDPTIDYRSLYSSILRDWLCVDREVVKKVMFDVDYEDLDLGFSCKAVEPITEEEEEEVAEIEENEALEEEEIVINSKFDYNIYYENRQTFIRVNNERARHMSISIFSISGKNLGDLSNKFFFEGSQDINIKEGFTPALRPGTYICRILSDDAYSKKFVIY